MKETLLKLLSTWLLKSFLPWLVESIKNQGFSWLLTLAAVAFFYSETLKLRVEVNNCNATLIQMYQKDREQHQKDRDELLKVVQANTNAIQNFKCK